LYRLTDLAIATAVKIWCKHESRLALMYRSEGKSKHGRVTLFLSAAQYKP